MPSKAYSKEQREEIRIRLLETGLALYSKHGIKNIGLMDILNEVNISKPFFYKFYQSVQEFVVCLLDYQWGILYQKMIAIESQPDKSRAEKMYEFFSLLIAHDKNGLLIMTQEEEVWVERRLGQENVKAFLTRQLEFFCFLLKTWEIPTKKCPPEVFANMIISILVVHGSAKVSLPFLYLDDLEEAAHTQAKALALHLASL